MPANLTRMAKCLTLNLPEGWEDATHLHENATFSFRRALPRSTGLLQVMIAEYQGGEPPNPTEADLIDFAVGAGNENHGGEMVSTFSGSHKLGVFGSAVFIGRNEQQSNYFQVWFLSNSYDLVYVIFESPQAPGDEELAEAQAIVGQLGFQ